VFDLERRIRHLERDDLSRALRKIAEDAGMARQMIEDLHEGRYGGGGGGVSCTFTLNVLGCGGAYLSGATVALKDPGGATVDTGTTDASGNYSHTVNPAAPGDVYTLTPGKSRFATGSPVSVTAAAGTVSGGSVTLSPASGYACYYDGATSAGGTGPNYCADPLPTTLYLRNSLWGPNPVTLTYDATNLWWQGCHVISTGRQVYDQFAGCQHSPSPYPAFYRLLASGGLKFFVFTNGCVVRQLDSGHDCTNDPGPLSAAWSDPATFAEACPPSTSLVGVTAAGTLAFGASAATLTVTET
jgi:hypothetical protein